MADATNRLRLFTEFCNFTVCLYLSLHWFAALRLGLRLSMLATEMGLSWAAAAL